ncbi:MAG: AAA family ATPase [Defluviitaleaceae bacterium]|nr:AAA family ATPase [Defluviitaleaceae bacterium]
MSESKSKLDHKRLKRYFKKNKINFSDMADNNLDIIGQKRASSSLEFGLHIKKKGYNIYSCGLSGTGKTTFSKHYAENIAKNEKTPNDLCYVYNFKKPKSPKLLTFPAGLAKVFSDDMRELVNSLIFEIPRVFSNKDYESRKSDIINKYQEIKDNRIDGLTEDVKKYNFSVKSTNSGIYLLPLVDGKVLSEEEYDKLSQETKNKISHASDAVQEKANKIMQELKDDEKLLKKDIEAIEYQIGLFTVGRIVSEVSKKYAKNDDVLVYLASVKEHILNNISDFLSTDSEDDAVSAIISAQSKKKSEKTFNKYRVNVLTNNGGKAGAPVVIEHNPTYSNLTGEIEYDNEVGGFSTDFMRIKSGSLHRANGGYLIIQAHDLFSSSAAWEALRRALATEKIVIEPLRECNPTLALNAIKPEPANLNVKIILVGTAFYYNLIYKFDDNFKKLFKIRADFDYEMQASDENISKVVKFTKMYSKNNNCKELSENAICKILEHSFRLSESQDKLTTQFSLLGEIILESNVWAELDNSSKINDTHVKKALEEREFRFNIYEEKLAEFIDNDVIIIDVKGKKVGEINALAVLDMGDYAFAKPSKVTATSYMGKAGIINIEKEANMSGRLHDKGVNIISGYLGHKYAQEFPLSLSARICFEQNYSGIDGDSASSTELYAILSSLSEIPISQEIAVTGSVNQFGKIQPIGGVSHKIEGFFDICKKRGLTGTQGVIIPRQNIKDLVLKDSVIDAVKSSKFSIYAIDDINEGIEILMGTPAKIVHEKVLKKLKKFHTQKP